MKLYRVTTIRKDLEVTKFYVAENLTEVVKQVPYATAVALIQQDIKH